MKPKGFTLLEVLMVVTLLIIMLAMSVAFSFRYLQQQQLRAVAENIVTSLLSAQVKSLGQVGDQSHGVAIFSDEVVEFTGPSYATRDSSLDVVAEFASVVTVSDDTEIIFSPGDFKLDRDYMITIADQQSQMQITVSQYGVLEIQ